MNLDTVIDTMEADTPLKAPLSTAEKIKVFTDSPEALSTLTDARFEIVAD